MKVAGVTLLAIVFFSTQSIAQNIRSSEEQNVYRTIVLIGNAWTQNNMDTLNKYIHLNYVHTDVRGQLLNRSTWLNYVKERKDKGVTNPGVEFDDIKISIFKDFAFVTGINTFTGQAYVSNDSTSNKPKKLRFTQVLKKEDNIWKRILFQATYIE